ASPEAARVGLASLMRPEGPLPDVPFAECRYAVARTKPQRLSRRNWPGGVMSSPLNVSQSAARCAIQKPIVNCLPVRPYGQPLLGCIIASLPCAHVAAHAFPSQLKPFFTVLVSSAPRPHQACTRWRATTRIRRKPVDPRSSAYPLPHELG